MPEYLDQLLVLLIVAAAAGYLVLRQLAGRRKGGCGGGCPSCPSTTPNPADKAHPGELVQLALGPPPARAKGSKRA